MVLTSVRLSGDIEARMTAVLEMLGENRSDFIRNAVIERLDRLADAPTSIDQLADFIGAVHSGTGSNARDSGRAFVALLKEKDQR